MTVLNLKKLAVASVVGVSAVTVFDAPASSQACYNRNGNLPPVDCAYAAQQHLRFPNGIDFTNPLHYDFRDIVIGDPPPTNIGDMQTKTFNSFIDAVVSINGTDQVLTQLPTTATTKITLTDIQVLSNGLVKKTFTNEMLSLDIQGLPQGALLRESPTLASTGITMTTEQADGRFLVDSFFDIFAEISLDGGLNWVPSEGSARVTAQAIPEPSATVPLALIGVSALWSMKRKQEQD